jgi:hypothetical protein
MAPNKQQMENKTTESSHVEFQESSGVFEQGVCVEVGEVLTIEKIEAIGKAIKHLEEEAYKKGYLQGRTDGILDSLKSV